MSPLVVVAAEEAALVVAPLATLALPSVALRFARRRFHSPHLLLQAVGSALRPLWAVVPPFDHFLVVVEAIVVDEAIKFPLLHRRPLLTSIVDRHLVTVVQWRPKSPQKGNIPTTTLQRTLTPRAAASASTASPAKRGAIVMLRAARTTAGTATKRAKTVTMIGEDPLRRRNAPRSTRSTLNIANTRRGAPMKETRMGRTVPVMRAVRRRRRRRAKRARSIASTASEAMTTRTVARRRKASLLLRTDQVRQPLPATLTLAPAPSGSTSRAKSRATRAARARKAKVGEEVEANEAVTMTAVPKKVVVVEEVGVAEEEVVDQVTKEGDSLLSLPPFYTLFTSFSAQAIYNCGSNCPTTFPSSSTLYFNIAISNSLSLHFTHTLLSLFR